MSLMGRLPSVRAGRQGKPVQPVERGFGVKVIVAQRDKETLEQLWSSLNEAGVEVYGADSAESVISCIQRRLKVDAVLTDMDLAGSNAYDLLRFFRCNLRFWAIPIIICSREFERSQMLDLIRAGARGFIQLPLPIDKLLSKIDHTLAVSRRTVLIVEPNPVLRQILGRMMARPGYQVLTANTGQGVLEMVRRKRVDVVIIDSLGLDLNPWPLLIDLKESQPLISVLFLVERDSKATEQQIVASGADGVVRKPIISSVLDSKVRELLQRTG